MAYAGESNPHFRMGSRGLLVFMDQRFLISVLDVSERGIRVSFPVSEFPQEGMYVNLHFQDASGHTCYESEVLAAARETGDGLLLKWPLSVDLGHHRNWWRIAADFRVRIKDHVHPRNVEGAVIDISGGGMLVRTSNGYDTGDNLDLRFRLPGDTTEYYALGQVVHTVMVQHNREEAQHAGIRFVNLEPRTSQALSRYVWHRLRELHTA